MAEETGSYDVFAGGVYGFSRSFCGVVHFCSVGYFYVLHCPVYTFFYVPCLIVCVKFAIRYECFHAPAAGTDECKYGTEERVVEQCTTHFHSFMIGVEVIYIYHYEPGRRCEEFTTPADEYAAWGYVGE